jgi:hypothetical protein
MGFTPATGTEISMGCVYGAFGLAPFPGANIGLNSTLGVNRQPPQAAGVSAIPASTETELSVDMGGLDTPQNYCTNALTLYTRTASFEGWDEVSVPLGSCGTGTTSFSTLIYFNGLTLDWPAAVGKTAYTNFSLTTTFNGNNKTFRAQPDGTGLYIGINASGVVTEVNQCPV